MREILFRGKTEKGEWVTGAYLPVTNSILYEKGLGMGFNSRLIIPETVGQYTGLTDKNGKRIFDGDIVTGLFLFEMSVKAVVTFKDGAFGLEWYRGDVKTFNAFTSICNVEYEVIGNVHDNPELLN